MNRRNEGMPRRRTQAVYVISVAAELAGMHAQTLRQYDRLGLVVPARQGGRHRRYSLADVERLQTVPGVKDTYTLQTFNAFTGG